MNEINKYSNNLIIDVVIFKLTIYPYNEVVNSLIYHIHIFL